MKTSPARMARAVAVVLLAVWAALATFNLAVYPGHGLGSFGIEDYQAAMIKVASELAAAESLTVAGLGRAQFHDPGPLGKAYAWGTVELRTPSNRKASAWVVLRWSPRQAAWRRQEVELLADPRQKLLFAESLLAVGNLDRLCWTLQDRIRQMRWRLQAFRSHPGPS